jgi:hypothetical protein
MPCYWIKDGFKLEKIDTEQWFANKIEQVKDNSAYLEEKRRLEVDELREQIIKLLLHYKKRDHYSAKQLLDDTKKHTSKILALFEGYKSPEELILLPLLSIDFEENTITLQATPDMLKGRFSVGFVGIDLSDVKKEER